MTSRLKPLREQARRQAVESARKKAELYAEATGVKLGHLLHLEDINPESFKERFHAPDVDLTAHDEAADPQNLQPGSVTVAGAVAVVYAILRG